MKRFVFFVVSLCNGARSGGAGLWWLFCCFGCFNSREVDTLVIFCFFSVEEGSSLASALSNRVVQAPAISRCNVIAVTQSHGGACLESPWKLPCRKREPSARVHCSPQRLISDMGPARIRAVDVT